MEEHVKKYLSRFFTVDGENNKVLDEGETTYANEILYEVVELLDLEEHFAKGYINIWVLSNHTSFDLESWWKEERFSGILPIAARVASQTVALDLVAVQPMNLPTGLLQYVDYQYSGTTQEEPQAESGETFTISGHLNPFNEGRVYSEEALQMIHERWSEQFYRNLGELDHPDNNVDLT